MDFDLFKSDWPIIRVTDNPIHPFITPEPDGGHYSLCREQQSCQVVHDLFVFFNKFATLGSHYYAVYDEKTPYCIVVTPN